MNDSRAKPGLLVAAISGVVLLVALLFLSWYSIGGEQGGLEVFFNVNASDAFGPIFWILLLISIGTIGLAVAGLTGVEAPVGKVLAVLGIVAVLLIGFRLIILPGEVTVYSDDVSFEGENAELAEELATKGDTKEETVKKDDVEDQDGSFDRDFGIFLALVAGIGIAGGGIASGGGAGRPAGGAPPPPAAPSTPAASPPPPPSA